MPETKETPLIFAKTPTCPCGFEDTPEGVRINFCALHKAAPKMLEALRRIKDEAYGQKQWAYVVDQCAVIAEAEPNP